MYEKFKQILISYSYNLDRLLLTVIIIIILFITRKLIIRFIRLSKLTKTQEHLINKVISYISYLLIFIVIFVFWLREYPIMTIFGVVGAGVAVALHSVILSFVGWLVLIFQRKYEIGDRIEIGKYAGDVIDISVLNTTLMEIGNWVKADQSTGRILIIPNNMIFANAIINYTKGFEYIWHELSYLITFESNWQTAEKILLKAVDKNVNPPSDMELKLNKLSNKFVVKKGVLTPYVYMDVKDSGVSLTLRYLIDARKRRSTTDQINRDILNEFANNDNINFAYPTYRIIN